MSRVITFSRTFPKGHPRAGHQTYFVEKIWQSLFKLGLSYGTNGYGLLEKELENFSSPNHFIEPKYHTIRAGHRWKAGDLFSPRIWGADINPKTGRSGPYHSKQIIIAPDIEVKKTWDFDVDECGVISINGQYFFDYNSEPSLEPSYNETHLAKNDGLSYNDFLEWLVMPCFRKHKAFGGQIICWNEKINY